MPVIFRWKEKYISAGCSQPSHLPYKLIMIYVLYHDCLTLAFVMRKVFFTKFSFITFIFRDNSLTYGVDDHNPYSADGEWRLRNSEQHPTVNP